jgi:branched-chain amino acid transport system permease protein
MQILLFGIISGLSIALLAIAMQFVYLPTRIIFIGLAGIYVLAPYLVFGLMTMGFQWWLAILLSIIVCVCVSMLCEILNHGPLSRKSTKVYTQKGLSETVHLISSLGIYIVISQLIVIIWGSNTKTLPIPVGKVSHFANLIITQAQWITLITAGLLIFAFVFFLNKTGTGLRMRAMVNNPKVFTLLGYNIKFYRILFFSFAGLFASVGSLLIAYSVGMTPYYGLQALLIALVAVIIGGQDSFKGAILGALLIGIIREFTAWQFSANWKDGITFLIFVIFLLLRPQGILGKKSRLEDSV